LALARKIGGYIEISNIFMRIFSFVFGILLVIGGIKLYTAPENSSISNPQKSEPTTIQAAIPTTNITIATSYIINTPVSASITDVPSPTMTPNVVPLNSTSSSASLQTASTPIVPTANSTDINLSGFWLAEGYTCRGNELPERISLEHKDGLVTATKVTGDDCVGAGEITWVGVYAPKEFDVQIQSSSGPNTALFYINGKVQVINNNSVIVSSRAGSIKYTRSRN
jgi:hypothetical protein